MVSYSEQSRQKWACEASIWEQSLSWWKIAYTTNQENQLKNPSIQVNKDAYDRDKKFSLNITYPALELTNIQDGNIGLHLQVPLGGTHPNVVGSELTIFFARIFVTYSWFHLQLIAIHRHRRGCVNRAFSHSLFSHALYTCVYTTLWLKVLQRVSHKRALIHMSSRVWSFVISPPIDLLLCLECLYTFSDFFISSIQVIILHVVGTAEQCNPCAPAEWGVLPRGDTQPSHIQSILLDWGVTAEIEHFVDNSSAITCGRRIGLGGMRHMETRYLWIEEELRAPRMKLTKVKGTENATDVATKHVDATTLMKCMVTIGLINRTRYLTVLHHKNVAWAMKKIMMHSTDSEVFQCRTHHEHAGLMRTWCKRTVMMNCETVDCAHHVDATMCGVARSTWELIRNAASQLWHDRWRDNRLVMGVESGHACQGWHNVDAGGWEYKRTMTLPTRPHLSLLLSTCSSTRLTTWPQTTSQFPFERFCLYHRLSRWVLCLSLIRMRTLLQVLHQASSEELSLVSLVRQVRHFMTHLFVAQGRQWQQFYAWHMYIEHQSTSLVVYSWKFSLFWKNFSFFFVFLF